MHAVVDNSNADVEYDSLCLTVRYETNGVCERISSGNVIAAVPASITAKEAQSPRYYVLALRETNGDEGERYSLVCKEFDNMPQAFLDEHEVTHRPDHLFLPTQPDGTSNLHVVISTKSGAEEAERLFEHVLREVLQIFTLSEGDYQVHKTTSEHSIQHFTSQVLLQRAQMGTAQTVILLSGDGGVLDMVNGLLKSQSTQQYVKPTVALLAMGTGNALANSVGLNRGSTKGLPMLLRGTAHCLPTFTATFSPASVYLTDEGRNTKPLTLDDDQMKGVVHGAVVCSWGLHASLVADSDTTEYRKYGSQRFQMAAKELLYPSDGSKPHSYRCRLTMELADGKGNHSTVSLDENEYLYILTTLVSNLEEKFTVSPHSRPLDGQLRSLIIGTLPSDEIARILGLAYLDGKHVEDSAVRYEAVGSLRIDFAEPDERWRRVCVDGKIIRVNERGWVEIRREAKDVLDLIASP